MGSKPSQRERDLAKRAAGQKKSRKPAVISVIAVVAVIGLIAWAARPEAIVDTRAANFAAFGLADDPFLGDPSAPVVLVGYESPHCSACQQFHKTVLPQLQPHIDNGSVVYYYIQGTIGNDIASSVAQECAYREGGNGAFWDITDRLYARSNTYTAPDWNAWLQSLAADHALDAAALQSCHEGSKTEGQVRADLRVGRDHGAQGTPTFWAFGERGEAQRIGRFTDVPSVVANLAASA